MPKTKKQKLAYTLLTILITVPCFVFYCSSYEAGGFSIEVIQNSWYFIPIELVLAFLCQELVGGPVSQKLLQKHVNPKKYSTLIVKIATVCFTAAVMCPLMSLLATILYDGIIAVGLNDGSLSDFLINFIPLWCQKVVLNFPFALLIQLFIIQPLVRKIFATYFRFRPAPQDLQTSVSA